MEIKESEGILFLRCRRNINLKSYDFMGSKKLYIIYGRINELHSLINKHIDDIISFHIEEKALNPRYPLYQYGKTNARIEYGAIIRNDVVIEDGAIILMGAIINKGATIKEGAMIDMGAVIGSSACIGKRVHVGANAVISGVMEPYSNKGVIIEDDAFIGANAVILEGIRIGKNAIVGAGAIVTKDVGENDVIIGNPGKKVKTRDEVKKNVSINMDLRR